MDSADKRGIELILHPRIFKKEKGQMTYDQLKDWYSRKGFVDGEDGSMVRKSSTPSSGSGEKVMYHQIGNNKIEILKNPSSSDLKSMRKAFFDKFPNAKSEPFSRKSYDSSGNEYVWRSDKASHGDVEPYLEKKLGTKVNQNKFLIK